MVLFTHTPKPTLPCQSTKTVLMSLFEGSGNTDIEGATIINACYGGMAYGSAIPLANTPQVSPPWLEY